MIETADPHPVVGGGRPEWARVADDEERGRHRLRAVVIGVVLLAVALFAGSRLVLRYAAPTPLSSGGVFGWAAPDNEATVITHLGPYNGLSVPARPGASQSFYFFLRNDSGVTQAVLGLADLPYEPGDVRARLAGSTTNDYRAGEDAMTYVDGPIVVRPHSYRVVRYTIRNVPCTPGNVYNRYWQEIPMRVRVGAFTRTETVSLGDAVFELTEPKDCPLS